MNRYVFVSWIAARQQWSYRGEMVMRSVSMLLFMGIFIALWTTAFALRGGQDLAGYSLPAVVWYLAMTETVALSSSRIFMEISAQVKSGDLAYTLTRPLSYPLFQVATSLGDTLPRFVINLLTASLLVSVVVGARAGSLESLLAFLVLAMLGLLIDALVAVLIGLSAFWMEEVMPLFWIYQKLLFTVGGLFLPLEFFPDWLKKVSLWLPFRYITNAPARAFVAFDLREVLGLALGQCAYILGLAGIVWLVWRQARRRMVVQGG